MLMATISQSEDHDYRSERMGKAFAFLREHDLSALENGRHEIDGDDVFANVMEYDTVPACEKKLEAHRRYYDVQCVAAGIERMEVAPLAGLAVAAPFDEGADFGLYETPDPVSSVVLHAGELAVLAPEDAHKPGCCAGADPVHVKKVVVKVRVGR